MSVERILGKITAHNSDVIGCVALHRGRVFDNLPAMYELVDRLELTDKASNIFLLTEDLQADRPPFDQVFLEFPDYSVLALRLEDGVLLVLNAPIERGTFKKMQVGVNLFMKPLRRALDELHEAPAPDSPPVAEPALDPEKPKGVLSRLYRGVRY